MASSSQPLDSIPGGSGPIADTTERARQLLFCCREIRDEDPRKVATAQLARFNLWASNIGVFAARHASLDYRLRTAPIVRITIEGNLEIICRHLLCTLKATTELSEEELNGFYDIDKSQIHAFGLELLEESSSNDELKIRELRFVEETIGTLHQISLAIRKASNRDSLIKVPRLFDVDSDYTVIRERLGNIHDAESLVRSVRFEISSAFENFVRKVLISRWFRPDQEAELDPEQKRYRQALLDCCVETVTIRRRQLAYFRNHQFKLAQGGPTKFMPTTQQKQAESKLLLPAAPKAFSPDQPVLYESSDAALSETIGSELQSTEFRPAPPSSAPSSTVSFTADSSFGSRGQFEVPPPPKLEEGEKEKACPYCCLVLPAKTFQVQKKAKRWEKHLLEDLQPYICLFVNCSQRGKSYSSFKDWQTHLNQPHTHNWICTLHSEDAENATGELFVFDRLVNFKNHLSTYHADLDSSTTDGLVQQASQLAVLPQCCFVCFEELPNVPNLQKHMANHLKFMSLLALPWRDDIESGEGLESDRLMSAKGPSDTSHPSEMDLSGINLLEPADTDGTVPAPTEALKPKEFAPLLSVVDANLITVQDHVRELETWTTKINQPLFKLERVFGVILLLIHWRGKARRQIYTKQAAVQSIRPSTSDVSYHNPFNGTDRRHIIGTPGVKEKLDSRYQVRTYDYKKSFRPGRVFCTLWTDPTSEKTNRNQTFISEVMREGCCNCLPVTSYEGRSHKKSGIELNEHGQIYSHKRPKEVQGMKKKPLKVILSKTGDALEDTSLVNYGRIYTVESNVKVLDVGVLDEDSQKRLQRYYRDVNFQLEDYFDEVPTDSKPETKETDFVGVGASFEPLGQSYQSIGQTQARASGYTQGYGTGYSQESPNTYASQTGTSGVIDYNIPVPMHPSPYTTGSGRGNHPPTTNYPGDYTATSTTASFVPYPTYDTTHLAYRPQSTRDETTLSPSYIGNPDYPSNVPYSDGNDQGQNYHEPGRFDEMQGTNRQISEPVASDAPYPTRSNPFASSSKVEQDEITVEEDDDEDLILPTREEAETRRADMRTRTKREKRHERNNRR
ncbi:hypothetical protein G7Y89_g12247 [Cudoniella acicularis]|uniref:DUF6590 domain-containing protein n=1 Tax=Cudoniella acicularis TaxID=354080 RepID=A0A8H4RCX9_9HELO|nr:hypothetical protein G7Y89_g12247 [Cudoniella acicularis]